MINRAAAAISLGSVFVLLAGSLVALARGPALEDSSSIIRDGFETPKISWRQERTEATVKIFAHDRTNRAAHEGVMSEGFQFEAGIGGGLYYSYSLPKVPITEELKVNLFVRSNRAGVQILGRVVLPSDTDPDTHQPSYVLVPGTIFETADRWQKLELADMVPEIERQARVVRASTKRKISLEGAYLERLVVNIYGGEGETEVYLDELSVGPVSTEVAEAAARRIKGEAGPKGPTARTIADRPRAATEPLESTKPGMNARIKLERNRLTRDGYPWFPSMVRAPGTDPDQLRRVGVDVLITPKGTPDEAIKAAVASGMLLIPELTGPNDRVMPDADRLASDAASFPFRDSVAFWSLGENLGRSTDKNAREATLKQVRDAAVTLRRLKPGGSPFTTGSVVGMLPEYARVPENLDLLGIPTAGWATPQDPLEMYQYLEQRRTLTARSNADTLFWATLDASAPAIYREAIWGTDAPPSWGLPRVQPEQLRTAAYAAVAAGCRGLCFRGDASLTQPMGRMNMIEMAFLNEEFDVLEPILGDPDKSIQLVDTYLPDPPPPPPVTLFQINNTTATRAIIPKEFPPNFTVRAAKITTKDRRGTLLMIADYSKYAQYQPGQEATNNLKLIIPAASDAHAYVISPGGVRALGYPSESVRGPGGLNITLDDFGVTSIVLITTNVELKNQIEEAINRNRPLAARLAIEQAELQRAWVIEIDSILQDRRHPQKDSVGLLNQSGEYIKSAQAALEREDYQVAWDEARRASRPLRILMRYHFMAAYDEIVKNLRNEELPCGPVTYDNQDKPKPRIIAPIVAAPLASFNTLPQAWVWADWIKSGKLGRNLMPSGNFEDPKVLKTGGWVDDSYQSDDIDTEIKIQKGGPDKTENGTNLVLGVKPKKGRTIDSLPPFVDHPIVAVRSPAVKVRAQEVYRISVMAYMAAATAPGAGGLIVRDSIGGERLQFRTPQALAMDWFEIVYYRRVPVDGTLSVTLGMAGYNYCAFDDLKIEPIVGAIDVDQQPVVVRPRRRPAPPMTAEAISEGGNTPARPTTATRSRPMPIRE